ncbi:MAG: potassium/proton antiporter [Parvularculaceae bacterium]|nr:potassium/proton antiporter [Parvularculaceae bacterium]
MEGAIFFVSALVFTGFLLIPLSRRVGAPILLLVLGAGMLAGEDGVGRVPFDNFELAFHLGTVALAIILFAGGLETDKKALKGVRTVSGLLASVGVVITAGIVGAAASFILDVPVEMGLLLGAVIGSTDAAATFLLIQQSRVDLPERLKNTLVLESGVNDPMAIFLTIAMTALVNRGGVIGGDTLVEFLPLFVAQIGVGAAIGVAGGLALAKLLNAINLPLGLYPPMALAGALIVFSAAALLGGSGFLAIYLCGLFLADRIKRSGERILHFSEGMQWLSQIALFLMLGLLVTPSRLVDIAGPALLIAAVLIFIARPVAVAVSTIGAGFRPAEIVYLGWVGLRGAVPIFLAMMPVITHGPVDTEFFNIVFVIVVASLVLQGWTVAASAKWLGLSVNTPPPLSTAQ